MPDDASAHRHHLGTQALHTNWDQTRPPRLVIDPGETVIVETMEASGGAIARMVADGTKTLGDPAIIAAVTASATPAPDPDPAAAMPGHTLTGPIAINGAEPGDTLVVFIDAVTPGSWGWTSCSPEGNGLLQHEVTEHTLYVWDLRNPERAPFAPGITVPLAPFCGVMGVAPGAPGPLSTLPPRTAGGNLDIRALTAGSTLYLPVEVAGALFSVGDAHAAQGDGEVCGTAIETSASVRLTFDLRKGENLPFPRYIAPALREPDGPWFAAVGVGTDLWEASRQALRGVLDYLRTEHHLSRAEAVMLASVCVNLHINQVVNSQVATVSALLPLNIFAT
jgi:acetamidase/formamidase